MALCTVDYPPGTTIVLTALPSVIDTTIPPAPPYNDLLAGWSGCDSTSGNTCTVTLTGPRSVTATFDLVAS
jgi:hypothetical protein